MIDIAIKNLSLRKARTLLCILAVLAGVFLVGVTLIMNTWMYNTMTGELAKYMGKISVQQGGSSYPPFDSTLNQNLAETILGRGDLGLNTAESTSLIFVRTERGLMPFLPAETMVIGVPAGKEGILFGSVEASAGVNRFVDDEQSYVAILGKKAASNYGVSVGKNITINSQPVRVIGLLNESSLDSVNISAIMPLAVVQKIFDKSGQVSSVLLTPVDFNETNEIAAKLEKDYPFLSVTTQADMLKDAQKVMQMPIFYMSSMGVTGLIVALLIIMSTMFMAVSERTREIGVLRAIGAQRSVILGSILMEALILALIGSPIALGLVALMAKVMDTALPTVAQYAEIMAAAVAAAVLGGAFPALRAANVEPLEALRYE